MLSIIRTFNTPIHFANSGAARDIHLFKKIWCRGGGHTSRSRIPNYLSHENQRSHAATLSLPSGPVITALKLKPEWTFHHLPLIPAYCDVSWTLGRRPGTIQVRVLAFLLTFDKSTSQGWPTAHNFQLKYCSGIEESVSSACPHRNFSIIDCREVSSYRYLALIHSAYPTHTRILYNWHRLSQQSMLQYTGRHGTWVGWLMSWVRRKSV